MFDQLSVIFKGLISEALVINVIFCVTRWMTWTWRTLTMTLPLRR